MDNIIVTDNLNAKHTDFNCTKLDKWFLVLKKTLCNADLFIVDNSKPTYRDGRTNKSDILDYIISSTAIFNKIQNLSLNDDLSSDHSAILFDFSTNLNKSLLPSINVELYCQPDRDSINSSLSKHLTVPQEQILNLISSKNADCINIINNAATILSNFILDIYNSLPEKNIKVIKPNIIIPLSIQLLIKQKKKN